ncbi:CHRD domain-containing protein [Seonamhaeicola maritimus]|uniref:CHRD domain-containing protein n=1 Tax=Seonamhaeicola maritimus TaxID=2591822 RepID=UPI0024948C16|nr:CHRD domain-containing protein [Seonamhaeicola maritimus]
MKTQITISMRILLCAIICLSLARCSTEQTDLENNLLEAPLNAKTSSKKVTESKYNFTTHLSGKNEVPARETRATGEAIVKISKDESMIYFKVMVANIKDVRAAHFHKAPAGSNGGVIIGLFLGPKKEGKFNGILTEGYITSASFSEDGENRLPLLIQDIRAGNIYINVHTDTFPPGELRGQL